jgi:uncharacterized protein YabE (DUF348 family)
MTQLEQAHQITYSVNGETESTSTKDLTVKEILENAGFKPATDYTLKSENPPHDFESNYQEVVEVHEHQRFQALFKGPTPTS